MLGNASRILIAQRAADAARSAKLPDSATIDSHKRWYLLGALGPAIGDFVPGSPGDTAVLGARRRSPYYIVWQKVLGLAVGDSDGTPGLVTTVNTFRHFLDRVTAKVKAKDFDGLKAMRDSGELDVVNKASADLGKILTKFSDPDQLKDLGKAMGNNSRPQILNELRLTRPSGWTGREFLHWKRPGAFATELRKRADASGDPRFQAYAIGWSVSYAALLCSSGFMCSLIGAGYRNHWWRSRWIGQFVDTWIWGSYGAKASMASDDTPSPAYAEWPGLCNARLHNLIDVTEMGDAGAFDLATKIVHDGPLPQVLPPEFVSFWIDAWNATYVPGADPLFTVDDLQRAYVVLWTTLWFQSSDEVIGCNPAPPPDPPGACGDNPVPPNWVDPTKPNPADKGKPFKAQTPVAKHDPNVAEVVSGIVLGILGIVATCFGGAAVGIPAIVAGIGLIVDGEKVLNWDELECQLYWLSVYLHTGIDQLHKLAVFGAIQPPYPAELASPTQDIKFGTQELPYTAGAAVCKSVRMAGMHQPWDGALSTWTSYPTNPLEMPLTDVWRIGGLWPSAIVDDTGVNPPSADLKIAPASPWPGGVEGSFGPAVQAAVDLISSPHRLPDYNLDSDRGRGWLTWQLSAPYATGTSVPAVPEA